MEEQYNWVDNPTVSGVAECDTDILNDCLMHLKYNNTSVSQFPLFSMIVSDHVLSGQEALGWALQGSIVSMVYSDALNQIIEEYDHGAEETVRGIDCRIAANGHIIADISQETAIDKLYYDSGVADFYILDKDNKNFRLPRTNCFHQFTPDTMLVNRFNEAGLPNLTGNIYPSGYISGSRLGSASTSNGAFKNAGSVSGTRIINETQNSFTGISGFSFDASLSNRIYGRSNTVQPLSSNKLLYYRVGDRVANGSCIDVANVLSTLEQKAYNDLRDTVGNLSECASDFFSGLGMPSDRYIDLSLGSSGSTYTAPANGWFSVNKLPSAAGQYMHMYIVNNGGVGIRQYSTGSGKGVIFILPCRRGDTMCILYDFGGANQSFRFIYAEGAN